MTAGRPRLVVMPARSGAGQVTAAAPVEMPAPADRLALGHRLGLGCLAVIVAVWFVVMGFVVYAKAQIK